MLDWLGFYRAEDVSVFVDAKVVAQEFKRVVWPVAVVHGFSKIRGTTIWRYRDGGVDVLGLQSSKWNMLQDESFEFFVNYGVHFTAIPPVDVRVERRKLLPKEGDCHIRERLVPTEGRDWKLDRQGANLERVFLDLQAVFEAVTLPFYRRFWDPSEAIRAVSRSEGIMGCPSWLMDYWVGHLELAQGNVGEARARISAFVQACEAEKVASPFVEVSRATLENINLSG